MSGRLDRAAEAIALWRRVYGDAWVTGDDRRLAERVLRVAGRGARCPFWLGWVAGTCFCAVVLVLLTAAGL